MRPPTPAAPPQRQAARHCPRAMQQHTRTDTRAMRGLLPTPARAADNGRRATDRRSAWPTGPTIISTVGPVTGRARTRPRSTAAATDSEALPAGPGRRARKMNMPLCEMIRFCTDSCRHAVAPHCPATHSAQTRTVNNQSPRARPARGAATATPPPGAGVSSGLPRVHGEEPDHAREG